MRPPTRPPRTMRTVSRSGPSSGSGRDWTSSALARPRATAATSPATPRTSTGAISTRRATTAASARIAGATLVGVAVVGHTFKHGVSAGFLADLVAAPEDGTAVRALVSRAVDEVQGRRGRARPASAAVDGAPPRAAPGRLRADEQEAALHRQAAPRRRPHRRARRARGTSPSATSTSSDGEARLHHAAGRPRAPGARGDGAEDPRRSPSSSTRSSCSRTGRSRACCRRTAASARSAPGTRRVRGARFETALARELRGLRGGAVVAHMCPIYAVLAAPLVRPLRIPLVLWFTHWRASRLLRAAERVSTAVTSVD